MHIAVEPHSSLLLLLVLLSVLLLSLALNLQRSHLLSPGIRSVNHHTRLGSSLPLFVTFDLSRSGGGHTCTPVPGSVAGHIAEALKICQHEFWHGLDWCGLAFALPLSENYTTGSVISSAQGML